MDKDELLQLLKYRQNELSHRMQEIKADFESEKVVDDILFSIAQSTKCELHKVKETLQALEHGEFDACSECHQKLFEMLKRENPFQTHCDSCDNKKKS